MNPAFLKKIKRNDRLARWVITGGGMAIISSVILILVLIAKVSLPLFFSADAKLYSRVEPSHQGQILAVGMDEYLETGYSLNEHGELIFLESRMARSWIGSSCKRMILPRS